MATVEQILKIATAELGYCETPAGSNRTKYGKWYGLDGNPWCMMFVQWVFAQAGASKLLPVKTASCGTLRNASRSKKQWITSGYRPGDVVIYDFPGGAETDHVGIVEKVTATGVIAIEGNTGAGNDANGGQVQRRVRGFNLILGAHRPLYETEDDEVDWSKITAADIQKMPDAAIDALFAKIQARQSTKAVSPALAKELAEAKELGITDGSNPNGLCTRVQAAVMVKRAVKK